MHHSHPECQEMGVSGSPLHLDDAHPSPPVPRQVQPTCPSIGKALLRVYQKRELQNFCLQNESGRTPPFSNTSGFFRTHTQHADPWHSCAAPLGWLFYHLLVKTELMGLPNIEASLSFLSSLCGLWLPGTG